MSLISRFRRAQPPARYAATGFDTMVDGRRIAVLVQRHARARVLRLRYDAPRGTLRLTMPPRHSLSGARTWVDGQHDWIARQIGSGTLPMLVVPGATLPWGDGGALTIAWDAAAPRTPMLDGDRLVLGGPADRVGARVRRWLIDRARREFADGTATMAARIDGGRALTGVSVADPRARWGSCAANGRIRYSWRLAMAPDFVRRSIVAHEVVHLVHMHHGPEFYALVSRLVGDDHDRARGWLRVHGARLHGVRF
jgi:predicted metal-dependent hydrolase